MTKQEVVDEIATKQDWKKSDVIKLIHQINPAMKPTKLQVGDVIYNKGILHMVLILAIKGDFALGVLLTSNEGFSLSPVKTRFLQSGYISKSCLIFKHDLFIDSFKFCYSNNLHVAEIKQKLVTEISMFYN